MRFSEKKQVDPVQRYKHMRGGGGGRRPRGFRTRPPFVTICGFFPGLWTVTRLFSTARCSVDLLLKVRQATALTPPFLFLHRRRLVVVKALRIPTALTFAQPPDRWCGTRVAAPPLALRRAARLPVAPKVPGMSVWGALWQSFYLFIYGVSMVG